MGASRLKFYLKIQIPQEETVFFILNFEIWNFKNNFLHIHARDSPGTEGKLQVIPAAGANHIESFTNQTKPSHFSDPIVRGSTSLTGTPPALTWQNSKPRTPVTLNGKFVNKLNSLSICSLCILFIDKSGENPAIDKITGATLGGKTEPSSTRTGVGVTTLVFKKGT